MLMSLALTVVRLLHKTHCSSTSTWVYV